MRTRTKLEGRCSGHRTTSTTSALDLGSDTLPILPSCSGSNSPPELKRRRPALSANPLLHHLTE